MGKSFGAKIPVLFFISLSCPHLISLSLHVYFFLPSLRHLLLLGLVLSSCSSTQSSQTSSLESLYDFPVPVTITYYYSFAISVSLLRTRSDPLVERWDRRLDQGRASRRLDFILCVMELFGLFSSAKSMDWFSF